MIIMIIIVINILVIINSDFHDFHDLSFTSILRRNWKQSGVGSGPRALSSIIKIVIISFFGIFASRFLEIVSFIFSWIKPTWEWRWWGRSWGRFSPRSAKWSESLTATPGRQCHCTHWNSRIEKLNGFGNIGNFLATLVALHFTPVSKSLGRWVIVSD